MLKDLLMGLLQKKTVPNPILENPKPKSDLPNHGQLYAALKQYQDNLPMDNLDGTFSNVPEGGKVFQKPGNLVELNPRPGLPHFDPLGTKDRYRDSTYPVLPINPKVMDRYKPMPFLQYMKENQ